MDIFGDHALVFQLRHRVVQPTLGLLLRQGGRLNMAEPEHLHLPHDEGHESSSDLRCNSLGITVTYGNVYDPITSYTFVYVTVRPQPLRMGTNELVMINV